MVECRAWLALSPSARAAYIEVARLYNGRNNGTLALSARTLAERLGVSKDTAARLLKELIDKGFIDLVQRGAFSLKHRHATEYRLTAYSCDLTQHRSSKAFMTWAGESRSDQRG